MFCEYDDPNFTHTSGGHKTTIELNYVKGSYHQMCIICRPSGHNIRYYSLFDHDSISIEIFDKQISLQVLPLSKDGLPVVFADYYKDSLIFNRNLCDSMIVYDKDKKFWVYVSQKQSIVTTMLNDMRKAYVAYTKARFMSQHPNGLSNNDKKTRGNLKKEFQVLGKPPAFAYNNKFLDQVTVYVQACKHATHNMDIFPELVPLNDGQCFNLFTGRLEPMKKEHFFTSRVNAVYKEEAGDEEDTGIIDDWYLKLSSGRPDLANYHKRVDALCMTFLPLDRKFYVELAPGGSNGKSAKLGVIKKALTDSSSHGQNRQCELNQSFFSQAATSKATAGGPRSDWMMVPHKTLYVVEEMPSSKLDTDILKKFGSHDSHQARQLYAATGMMDIQLRGHLVINTNNILDLGDATATWDRTLYIPWDSIWVEHAKDVDHSKHKYLRDQSFVTALENKLDSFVSVCLRALSAYLMPFVVEGNLTITDMEVPACVAAYTEEFKNKAMAVQVFFKKCMRPAEDPDSRLSINDGYTAYNAWQISVGGSANKITQDEFYLKLKKHNIRIITDQESDYFAGFVLNDEGLKHTPSNGRMLSATAQFNLFNPQQKRRQV